MVQAFYKWWVDELSRTFAPKAKSREQWQSLLIDSDEGIELVIKEDDEPVTVAIVSTAHLIAGTSNISEAIKNVKANSTKTLLRLSDVDILERTIQIPKGASDVIEPVLKNQMERMVPWAPDETCFGFEIIGDNTDAPEKLDIRVVATTNSVLERARTRAKQLRLNASAIDYADKEDGAVGLKLLNLEETPEKRIAQRIHTFFIAGILTGLLASAGGIYLYAQRNNALTDVDRQLASLKGRVEKLDADAKLMAERKADRDYLYNKKQSDPAVMVLLESLSRTLPNSAYIKELQLDGRKLTITGVSDDPTELVEAVEQAPHFKNARFVAATTVDEEETRENFSIEAETLSAPISPIDDEESR